MDYTTEDNSEDKENKVKVMNGAKQRWKKKTWIVWQKLEKKLEENETKCRWGVCGTHFTGVLLLVDDC